MKRLQRSTVRGISIKLQEEERVAGAEADTAGPSFASWSRERELVWGSGEEAGQLQLGRWSTLVILGVSGATAAAFITGE